MNTETILLPLWLLMGLDPNWVANTNAPRQPRFTAKRGRRKAIKKNSLEKELAFEVEFEQSWDSDYIPPFDSCEGSQIDTPNGSVPVAVSAIKPSAKHFEPKAWKHVKANY
jgi:hypothetical protein